VDGVFRTKECFPGTIDNLFRPTYDDLLVYKHRKEKKYDIIVAATGPWNHRGKPKWYSPKETREYIQQVIKHLNNEIPKDVLLIWKTSLWSWFGDWNVLKDNETVEMPKGNNYLVHYANQVAKETILEINSTRRIVLDFAAEMAPYSWEQRAPTNMAAENDDYVPWHIGPKARVLFAQMLAWEIARYRNSTLLSGVGMKNSAANGIAGRNHSQNSKDTSNGSGANETNSGSSATKQSSDNNEDTIEADESSDNNEGEIEVDSSTTAEAAQVTDPPFETRAGATDPAVEQPVHPSGAPSDETLPSTKLSTEPPGDFMGRQDYLQIPRNLIPETPTIRYSGVVLLALYGIKMRWRWRSRTRKI
jgi:hypothetical protein